jgi:hypothetical protein
LTGSFTKPDAAKPAIIDDFGRSPKALGRKGMAKQVLGPDQAPPMLHRGTGRL